MVIPLDAIGYMNCFCKKKLRLFSSILSFISSNFICLILLDVAINFGKDRYRLTSFFGRVTVLCLIPVSTFPCPSRILFLLTVSSCLVLLVYTCPLIQVYLLLLFFVRVFRRILPLFVGRW